MNRKIVLCLSGSAVFFAIIGFVIGNLSSTHYLSEKDTQTPLGKSVTESIPKLFDLTNNPIDWASQELTPTLEGLRYNYKQVANNIEVNNIQIKDGIQEKNLAQVHMSFDETLTRKDGKIVANTIEGNAYFKKVSNEWILTYYNFQSVSTPSEQENNMAIREIK